ncbi:MAG: hypothetical protein OHK0017_04260 [Patescibacteria group bacterium]
MVAFGVLLGLLAFAGTGPVAQAATNYSCPPGTTLVGTDCVAANRTECPAGATFNAANGRCVDNIKIFSCPNGGVVRNGDCVPSIQDPILNGQCFVPGSDAYSESLNMCTDVGEGGGDQDGPGTIRGFCNGSVFDATDPSRWQWVLLEYKGGWVVCAQSFASNSSPARAILLGMCIDTEQDNTDPDNSRTVCVRWRNPVNYTAEMNNFVRYQAGRIYGSPDGQDAISYPASERCPAGWQIGTGNNCFRIATCPAGWAPVNTNIYTNQCLQAAQVSSFTIDDPNSQLGNGTCIPAILTINVDSTNCTFPIINVPTGIPYILPDGTTAQIATTTGSGPCTVSGATIICTNLPSTNGTPGGQVVTVSLPNGSPVAKANVTLVAPAPVVVPTPVTPAIPTTPAETPTITPTVETTPLTTSDIPNLTVICNGGLSVEVNSTTVCVFQLPPNKTLPPDLKLGIGDGTPAGQCVANGSTVTCTGIPTGTLTGRQPVKGQIGNDSIIETGGFAMVVDNSPMLVRTGGSNSSAILPILILLGLAGLVMKVNSNSDEEEFQTA